MMVQRGLKLRFLSWLAAAAFALAAGGTYAQEKTAPAKASTPSSTPASPAPAPAGNAAGPAATLTPQQMAAKAAQQPPKQLTGTTSGWSKVCQKIPNTEKEGCTIVQEVYAENGAFLASMAITEISGEQKRQLVITTPLGMALQAGLLMRVDNNSANPAKFGTCLVNGCFAPLEISTDLIGTMKKGASAFITVRNIQGAALDLTVPLGTFAKAYDGPAMDLAAIQEQQKKLQEELLKRAEKAREDLLKQQGGAPKPTP